MTAKSPTGTGAANSSAPSQTKDRTENSETLPEAFMKAISGNPRFQEAKKSGKAFIIGGKAPNAIAVVMTVIRKKS
jgi:hypothetical protein